MNAMRALLVPEAVVVNHCSNVFTVFICVNFCLFKNRKIISKTKKQNRFKPGSIFLLYHFEQKLDVNSIFFYHAFQNGMLCHRFDSQFWVLSLFSFMVIKNCETLLIRGRKWIRVTQIFNEMLLYTFMLWSIKGRPFCYELVLTFTNSGNKLLKQYMSVSSPLGS